MGEPNVRNIATMDKAQTGGVTSNRKYAYLSKFSRSCKCFKESLLILLFVIATEVTRLELHFAKMRCRALSLVSASSFISLMLFQTHACNWCDTCCRLEVSGKLLQNVQKPTRCV